MHAGCRGFSGCIRCRPPRSMQRRAYDPKRGALPVDIVTGKKTISQLVHESATSLVGLGRIGGLRADGRASGETRRREKIRNRQKSSRLTMAEKWTRLALTNL
jgi:hypothetical protein